MMNEYQMALDIFGKHAKVTSYNINNLLEANEVLQELVDKETPMKPKEYYSCPDCGCIVVDEYKYFDYCPDCGQKIDWGNNLENTSD